ncbi:unnamed protein product [Protopolystoma xenopodis]|uniref:Uncharacterized protein n=1 Tax=Protopolystoma xenopodis TaxID=117903 RepID=A0A448WZ13_9PLAT|nr:unnamed protein product [Protopolystoma xenopodis]
MPLTFRLPSPSFLPNMSQSHSLSISKNLLKMNFMKRSLITNEKNNAINSSKEGFDPQDGGFSLPPSVKIKLDLTAKALKRGNLVCNAPSLFKLSSVPPGFRESYSGFNKSFEELQKGTDLPMEMGDSSFSCDSSSRTVETNRNLKRRRAVPGGNPVKHAKIF